MTRSNRTASFTDMKNLLDFMLFLNKLFGAIDLATTVTWYLTNVVNPLIGIAGLTGNITGLFVITKCGLNRISNILVFYLTLADILCLIGSVNIPFILSTDSHAKIVVWMVPHTEATILSAVYMLVSVLSKTGYGASIHITIWIMVERLLAIFFPLTFTILVTPARVWLLGLTVLCASCSWNLYAHATENVFLYDWVSNSTGGIHMLDLDDINEILIYHIAYVFLYWIPVIVITLGCIVISAKLVSARKKRGHLTSVTKTQKSSSRVTATFLMICLKVALSQIILLPKYFYVYTSKEEIMYANSAAFFFDTFATETFIYVNSACDFVIFVALNKKFRSVFLHQLSVSASPTNIKEPEKTAFRRC